MKNQEILGVVNGLRDIKNITELRGVATQLLNDFPEHPYVVQVVTQHLSVDPDLVIPIVEELLDEKCMSGNTDAIRSRINHYNQTARVTTRIARSVADDIAKVFPPLPNTDLSDLHALHSRIPESTATPVSKPRYPLLSSLLQHLQKPLHRLGIKL